jgi:hypothetical protein
MMLSLTIRNVPREALAVLIQDLRTHGSTVDFDPFTGLGTGHNDAVGSIQFSHLHDILQMEISGIQSIWTKAMLIGGINQLTQEAVARSKSAPLRSVQS